MKAQKFKLGLKNPVCIKCLSEDEQRQLVDAVEVEIEMDGIVFSSGGVRVKFEFGSDGNFAGVNAFLNGQSIPLIHGVNSKALYIFEGPPSGSNPGPGWEVEPDLTKTILGQQENENTWTIFFARRKGVVNTFS